MMQRTGAIITIFLCLLPFLVLMHLDSGPTNLNFSNLWKGLFEFDHENMNHLIIREIRLPRMITAMLAGSSLAISGMLLQTILHNPLAGPYILGINSGASLMVALYILSGVSISFMNIGIIGSGMIGALLSSVLMIILSGSLKSKVSLILSGIMFGSFISAVVTILQYSSNPEALKSFTLWSMGSLEKVEFQEISIYGVTVVSGIFLATLSVKYLNVLVIGDKEAKLLGVNIIQTRILVLIAASILAGVSTAFCGPIAFVGMAIPNLVRIILKTQNHTLLLIGNFIVGACFLLFCDILVQKLNEEIEIPLNAITSIIGAPFILLIVLKKLK